MNYDRCIIFGDKECKKTPAMTLSELESAVFEITKKQNYISNCGLSAEVTALAIKELQEQKKELLKLMHKKLMNCRRGVIMDISKAEKLEKL